MTYNTNLSQELKNELLNMGASIVGFADLREILAKKEITIIMELLSVSLSSRK